jgi:adenosine deaminase
VNLASLRALPKAEVHVHLEGCFEAADIAELAREAGESPRALDAAGLDLATFLEVLDWTCGLVRTPEQVARAAYAFAAREARSGVGYADLIVNPTHWSAWRNEVGSFIDALDAGLAEAEQDGLPPVGLCISLLRQQSASEALELLDILLEHRQQRVVALSIDGNEAAAGRTGPRFAEAFRTAKDRGLHRTVHAGESSGPDGVWDALEFLCAERIDHGVRAIEDARLVATLAERKIPLDTCPGSNVLLGLYPDRERHPLDVLRTAGVSVSINTDDPALMQHTVESEYDACAQAYAWDAETIRQVARTSITASFCDDEVRQRLLTSLDLWAP